MPVPQTPRLTVDVVVECADQIVLIERRHAPHGLALPGGFVSLGERVEEAARREMREEIGLEVTLSHLLGVYSDPERDPRGHTVSVVFVGTASGLPRAGSDAARATLYGIDEIPFPDLVFDHRRILQDYLRVRRVLTPEQLR